MFEARFDASRFFRALDNVGTTFARPAQVMRRPLEDWLVETERLQFATQGAAGRSGRWQPLAPATQRRRAIEGRGYRILENSGRMRALLTSAGGLRQLIEMTDDKIIFRLVAPATFHQTGTRRMPQRKVYDPSDEQKRRLGGRVKSAAVEEMKHKGLPIKSR
jgi:hypothetical protein